MCLSRSLDTRDRSEIGWYSDGDDDGGEVLGIGVT